MADVETLILDSGADFSLAPWRIAAEMGLRWEDGLAMAFKGINHDPKCSVEVRLFDVPVTVHRTGWRIVAPVAFSKTDVPLLAGRDGFLDCFEIILNGAKKSSILRLL